MCIECQRSTPSAETFSKIVFSASEKIDLTSCCPFLIKNTIVGHVIVRLDYTVTENVMGSLDIKIKPQFFFFFLSLFPEGFSNSGLSLFRTLQSKMQLIRKTQHTVCVRDSETEESREIMQPRLTVMDS